jgi:hypothetical protein
MDYQVLENPDPSKTGENYKEKDSKPTNNNNWTMLLRLATGGNDDEVNIVTIHKEIFAFLRKADPSLTIKTTTGTTIDSIAEFPAGNEYQVKFSIKETRNQFTVAHPVHSEKTLDQIKRHNHDFLAYLKHHNIFIDVSASGSMSEVVLGPWFGVHPDYTSKISLKKDLIKLVALHNPWTKPMSEAFHRAKSNLAFEFMPEFQLRTRRIRREINDIEYSAKTTVFICAEEHRDFWELVLVDGIADGWLLPLGRFYLLQKQDHTPELAAGICWHNKMLNSMKAIVIRGVSQSRMDDCIKPPHKMDERPTLREKLHAGGFITIISSNEKDKWIGIAENADIAADHINLHMNPLCATLFTDGTLPTANRDPKPSYHPRSRGTADEKSVLFDKQSKSWADIAGKDADGTSTTHTESNIARRTPAAAQFKSRIVFDIQEVVIRTKPEDKPEDEQTKITTNDSMTLLTQDDLKTLKDEICAQFKDEISSAISSMSTASTSNDAFQSDIQKQITQQNKEMHDTMHAMKTMMMSMQRFVETALPRKQRSNSDGSDSTSFKDVTQFEETPLPQSSDTTEEPPITQEHEDTDDRMDADGYFTQPSKRRAPTSKGASPAAKRTINSPERRAAGRNGDGGRGGRGPPPRRSVRQNLANQFEPLATSNAPSSNGLN